MVANRMYTVVFDSADGLSTCVLWGPKHPPMFLYRYLAYNTYRRIGGYLDKETEASTIGKRTYRLAGTMQTGEFETECHYFEQRPEDR